MFSLFKEMKAANQWLVKELNTAMFFFFSNLFLVMGLQHGVTENIQWVTYLMIGLILLLMVAFLFRFKYLFYRPMK